MLKRIIFSFSALLLVLLLSNCKKTADEINEATEFDINYSTEVAIPSASIGITAPADFTTPQVPTQSTTKFASEKTAAELIDEIKLTKFILSNPTGNLDYLKSLSIFIKADGVAETLVATKTNIPAGSTSVSMDLSGANIKDYIIKDKIQFRVAVTISTELSYDQKLKIEQTVRVKGKKIK